MVKDGDEYRTTERRPVIEMERLVKISMPKKLRTTCFLSIIKIMERKYITGGRWHLNLQCFDIWLTLEVFPFTGLAIRNMLE